MQYFMRIYKCKKLFETSVLVGTVIKAIKQAAEMNHELSACILILIH